MAANKRPKPPIGTERAYPRSDRLLAWLRAHPFDLERVKREAYAGWGIYKQAMK